MKTKLPLRSLWGNQRESTQYIFLQGTVLKKKPGTHVKRITKYFNPEMFAKLLKVACGRVDFQVRILGANRQKKYSVKTLKRLQFYPYVIPKTCYLLFGIFALVFTLHVSENFKNNIQDKFNISTVLHIPATTFWNLPQHHFSKTTFDGSLFLFSFT